MNNLEKKLKKAFPDSKFIREVPGDFKNDTTVTLRMNRQMVSVLKEIAAKKKVSYQFLIKNILWNYIESFDEIADKEKESTEQLMKMIEANRSLLEKISLSVHDKKNKKMA